MGLEQTQDAHQVDKFVTSLLGSNKSLEDRVAQLEANEGSVDFTQQFVIIEDRKAAGTHAGASTSGSWLTRTLNTEVADPSNLASLASNQITLAAGTYYALISAPALTAIAHQIRLRNITTGLTIAAGTSEYVLATDVQTRSVITAYFTLSVQSVLEVQYRVQNGVGSYGLGRANNFGESEVYTQVLLQRVA